MTGPDKPPTKGIKSVEVAFRVLRAVQQAPRSLQLSEIASAAGLTPGSAHNYLVSLARTGLIEREARGLYRLGPSALALSLASLAQLDGSEHAREEADILSKTTGLSTGVCTWSQAGPVVIYVCHSLPRPPFELRPGLIPLLTSAAGQLFMAHLDPVRVGASVLQAVEAAGDLPEPPERIIRDAKDRVGSYGFVFNPPYPGKSHATLAAPVWDRHGRIVFVLCLLGTQDEVDPERRPERLRALKESAARASSRLFGAAASEAPAA